VLAARKLGRDEVPVIVLRHLTSNQRRAFMIADNKLALHAGWDEDLLRLELEALAEQQFPLGLTGFDDEDLKQLLAAENLNGHVDADDAPPPEVRAVTLSGDVWELGRHRILCADATAPESLQRVLAGSTCDLVFTDLPYNVDYHGKGKSKMKIVNDNLGAEFAKFLAAACRSILSVSAGSIYVCMSSSELHHLYAAFVEAGGHWSTYIIWAKSLFTLGRSDFQRQYEPILYGWREGGTHYWCGARDQGDVWFVDKPRVNDLHPTMKPVELVERAIVNSSRKSGIVLDPFAGSGTTAIACERTGRRARLIELDPRYVDVTVRRWQDYTGGTARLEREECSFEEASAKRAA
jgi:DNA modification methylase